MIDLQVPNTAEAKYGLIYQVAEHPELLPPVYVLSHKRADNLVTYRKFPWLKSIATLVVAHSQESAYRAAGWGDNLMVIPAGFGGHDAGIGRALQYILETADMLGHEHILTVHDDLIMASILYETEPGKVSRAWNRWMSHDREGYQRGVLALMAVCAEEAFAASPDAVIASPQVNNANRTLASSRKRWELNAGGNPAQLQYWRVDRFLELTGGMNLTEFNYHGEDISLACDIIENGGQVVNLPTFITDYLDYETESVIRDPSNAHVLRQGEHDSLMEKVKMAPYIKTRYDLLDRPQWHSLNWPLLKKEGLARADEALWTDPVRIPSVK